MASPWLRLNADFHLAPKLIKAKAAGIWPHVLTALKRGDGHIDADELDAEVFEALTHIPAEIVEVQFEGLKRVGLLVEDAEGWTTPGWDRYQPDPGASDRAKAWRESNEAKAKVKSPRTGPNSSERSRTGSNGSQRTERERTPDGTGRYETSNNPPTPQGGDEGEGEQDQGYYSERGGNRPAPTPAPPPVEPVVEPPLPDEGPPPRDHPLFQRALRLLEKRLIDCAPVTQRHGKVMTLGSVALAQIADWLVDYGPQALFDRLPECATASNPFWKLQASIKANPPPKIGKPKLELVREEPDRRTAADLTPAQRARNVLLISEAFLGDVEEAVAKLGDRPASPELLEKLAKRRAEVDEARENLARVTAGAA